MNKVLTGLLVIVAFAAQAATYDFDPDWTVVNQDKSKVYTLLPKTAVGAMTKSGTPYVTIMGEFRQGITGKPERFRLGVNGCDSPDVGGVIVFAMPNGETVLRKDNWVSGGGRVYDQLAVGACNAHGIATGKFAPLDPPSAPAPAAPSRSNPKLQV